VSACTSTDGKTIASGSGDDTLRLWEVTTGKERLKVIGKTTGFSSIAFSPDGKTIASAGGAGNAIQLWDMVL
jgi:WD40 repeat protein